MEKSLMVRHTKFPSAQFSPVTYARSSAPEICVSSPGKIILAGEHAVVYGYPAIVAAIDRRLTVTVKPGKTAKKYSGLTKFALDLLEYSGQVEIKSDLPIGSGFGSSAALATALVWAIKPQASLAQKNRRVKIIEDYQHCKSSGVDQTIVREGGFLKFQKGKFQSVKLPLKQAILIDSGRPVESTGEMVAAVAANFQFSKSNFQKIFKQIGKIADNWSEELISENERLLEELGVVGEKAKRIIRQIELIGGMAKICGAGGLKAGSGILLAYHLDQARLIQLIKQKQWSYFQVNLGASGVKYER